MTENAITITLDDVLGTDGLEGAWEAMVRRLADSAASKWLYSDANPDSTYPGRSFHDACVRAINEALQTKIAEHIEQVMAKPIQRTNAYGEPQGEAITFQQMLGEAVDSALTQTYDSTGRRTTSQNGYNNGKTLFQHALENIAGQELRKHVDAAVKQVKTEATAKIGKLVAEAIAAKV